MNPTTAQAKVKCLDRRQAPAGAIALQPPDRPPPIRVGSETSQASQLEGAFSDARIAMPAHRADHASLRPYLGGILKKEISKHTGKSYGCAGIIFGQGQCPPEYEAKCAGVA